MSDYHDRKVAANILNDIINLKITTEQILEWLTTDNPYVINFPNVVQTDSTRVEFILYFLDFVKTQCHSTIHVKTGDNIETHAIKNQSDTLNTSKNDNSLHFEGKVGNESTEYDSQLPKELSSDYSYNFSLPNYTAESIGASTRTSTPISKSSKNNTTSDAGMTASSVNWSKTFSGRHEKTEMSLNASIQSPQSYSSSMGDYRNNLSGCLSSSFNSSPKMNDSVGFVVSEPIRQSINDYCASNSAIRASDSPRLPMYVDELSRKQFENVNNTFYKSLGSVKNLDASSPIHMSAGEQNHKRIQPSSGQKGKKIPLNSGQKSKKNQPNRSLSSGDFLTPDLNHSKTNKPRENQSVNNSSSGQKNKKIQLNSGEKSKKNQPNRSLSLGDFLPSDFNHSKTKKPCGNQSTNDSSVKKNKRRIKPTKLISSSNPDNQHHEVFGIVSRPTISNPQFVNVVEHVDKSHQDKCNDVASFEAERELLKLERQKQSKIDCPSEMIVRPDQKTINPSQVSSSVTPNVELVDNVEILSILAEIYGHLLTKNLVPNPMTELHFIISLITYNFKCHENQTNSLLNEKESLSELKKTLGCSDIIDDDDDDDNEELVDEEKLIDQNQAKTSQNDNREIDQFYYLNSVHNCVYFATTVLFHGKIFLAALDRATLKLLSESPVLIPFQPALRSYLNDLYETKCLKSRDFNLQNNSSRILPENVCFQIETDNRENFPSTQAFTTFRKQRDLFYEILKNWEDTHLKPDFSFHKTLERKINTMLTMHKDAVNYYHIARLFKSQLLMSSIQVGQSEASADEETLSILKSLTDLNPEKFQLLQQRLITPLSSEGAVPQPSFPGIQEFYRDFLLTSTQPKFNVILEHCFVQEIIELNNTQFSINDMDTKGISEVLVDEDTKQNYLMTITSLRILAKFLGLIISMPYHSEMNDLLLIETQIALRTQIRPSLDVKKCIYDAITQGKLTLTVPWIIQYLAMMDSVSFRLPYYTKLCKLLYCIYRACQTSLRQPTALLLTFSIGWLFELPNFPKDLYFTWHSTYSNKTIQVRSGSQRGIENSSEQPKVPEDSNTVIDNCIILDELNIIDDRAFYACCPFLKDFKVLLISGNSNLVNQNANRHIKPVSCQLSQPSHQVKTMTLELQLEEAFFHGQPSSIRKTIEFISERVASNCVKYICRSIIRTVKEKNFKLWKKSMLTQAETGIKIVDMSSLILSSTKEIRDQCDEVIPTMCRTKIQNSVDSLVADDVISSVKDICVKIALRIAMEKIDQWLDFHVIALDDMFNDMTNLKLIDDDESDEKNISSTFNSDIPLPTSIINDLRNSIWEMIEKNKRWAIMSEENIIKSIKNLEASLSERNNIVPSAEKALFTLSVDYALHLIVFYPDLMTQTVENCFINIWKIEKNENLEILFSGILSPRNIKLFSQNQNIMAWKRFGKFIRRLLQEDILTMKLFSDQCVQLLRFEWPVPILKALSSCLTEAIENYKSSDMHTEKIQGFISWIAEMCTTMNYY